MGGKCTRPDGAESTTVSRMVVGKDYQEFPDQLVGEGIRRTPSWKSTITRLQLANKRKEFWETRSEGRTYIWQVIRQAVDADPSTAEILLDAAEVTMPNGNLVTLVSRGQTYNVPIFVINDPLEFNEGKQAPIKRKNTAVKEILVKIRCFQVSQKDVDITILNSKTILDLKQEFLDSLEDKKPLDKMRVFFNGKELPDTATLQESDIRRKNVVQIMLRK